MEAYGHLGDKVWTCELEAYGKVKKHTGDECFIPFRFQGQYHDSETGLYYNRFRYYAPDEGMYVSQDPIGLEGGEKLYDYVHNTNAWVDTLGLAKKKCEIPDKIKLTREGVDHVKERHIGNNPDWEHKSKWTGNNADWKTTTRDTFRNPDKITPDGDRFIFEKTYKTPVGVDPDGTALYKVRVVTESNGDLVTSFPQLNFK